MKNCWGRWIAVNGIEWCRRTIALFLAILMVADMGVDVLASTLSRAEIEAAVREAVAESEKAPEDFLQETVDSLTQAMSQESTQGSSELPKPYTLEQYTKEYTKQVEKDFTQHGKELDQAVQDALAQFDKQAALEESKIWGAALHDGVTENMSVQLSETKQYIQQARVKYEEQLQTQKATFLEELNKEKAAALQKAPQEYKAYLKEVERGRKEMADAQSKFLQELVHETVLNYQKVKEQVLQQAKAVKAGRTGAVGAGKVKKWKNAKENFVTIMMYMSSFEDKDKLFTKEDKSFVLAELKNNFSLTSRACDGYVEKGVKSEPTTQSFGFAPIGGSPSASHMMNAGISYEASFKLSNPEACDVAMSSFIPFANLGGNGRSISSFIQTYMDNPMFGQLLLVGTKAMLLTNNHGTDALGDLIDKAIAAENKANTSTFWDKLDFGTGEGLFRNILFSGKYMAHNVSSSAARAAGEPNVWEDVAYMLAEKNTTQTKAILQKAVDQCAVVSVQKRGVWQQRLSCRGIKPFLFGVLVHAPKVANSLKVAHANPYVREMASGRGADGSYFPGVSAEQAAKNREYNKKHDIANRYTWGELLAVVLFYGKSYEDLHPKEQQRMDALLAKSHELNVHRYMDVYKIDSDIYKKKERAYNAKIIAVAMGSSIDLLITLSMLSMVTGVFKAVAGAKNLSNLMKVRKIILEYKHVGKSAALLRGLRAGKIEAKHLKSYRALVNKEKAIAGKFRKVSNFNTKVLTRARETWAPVYEFAEYKPLVVAGKTTQPGLRMAAHRPLAQMGAEGAVQGVQINGWRDLFRATGNSVKKGWDNTRNYLKNGGNPWKTTEANGGAALSTENLTVIMTDKKNRVIKINEMSAKGGVLYINGQMTKTFKAYLPMDQLEAFSALAKEQKLALGMDGVWIKLYNPQAKVPFAQKFVALDKNVETVPLYNRAGAEIMHVGFNPGYKAEKALLDMLKGENATARLVLNNGKLYLVSAKDGQVIRALDEFTQISIPKTVFSNLTKEKEVVQALAAGEKAKKAIPAQNIEFLNKLFHLPTVEKDGLYIRKTGSKVWGPLSVNFLSYSASSSALMLTLENDMGWDPLSSMLVGMGLPYISSFLAPALVPFVYKFGARTVLNSSLWLAIASLGISMASGWSGKGPDTLRDGQPTAAFWILLANAFLTGLSSTGIRAASNVIVKGYELSERMLPLSMAFKSVGALATTAAPALLYTLRRPKEETVYQDHRWSSGELRFRPGELKVKREKNWDFSSAYWVLLPVSVAVSAALRLKMPKLAKPNYVLFKKENFKQPLTLLKQKESWPYVTGIALMSALEGYVYFKAISTWERDQLGDGKNPYVKLGAAVLTAVPQFVVRYKSPRKSMFGKGVFNSALLSIGGTTAFMLTPEDSIFGGVAGGLGVGVGTAQVFQYTQKLHLKRVGFANEKTAAVLHSAGNIGMAFPILPAYLAKQRRENLGEREVEAAKNTAWIPLAGYGAGVGLIAAAEFGVVSQITAPLRFGFNLIKGGVKAVAKPFGKVVWPAVIGGETLLNTSEAINSYQKPMPSSEFMPSAKKPGQESLKLEVDNLNLDYTLPAPSLQLQPSTGALQGGFGASSTPFQLQEGNSK